MQPSLYAKCVMQLYFFSLTFITMYALYTQAKAPNDLILKGAATSKTNGNKVKSTVFNFFIVSKHFFHAMTHEKFVEK